LELKYVIVEQKFRGRFVALRGLSFKTQEAAEAHIVATFNEKYYSRYHVEGRAIKAEEQRMHCQCCGRAILAKLGTIAHHGYERLGYGWQTNSCMGAKQLPFEVDRKMLGRLIVALQEMQARMQSQHDQIANETLPVVRNWKSGWGPKEEKKSFSFTRENFGTDEAKKALRDSGRYEREFDELLKVELAYRDSQIRNVARDIKEHQKRFDNWTQTHEWKDGEWAVLQKEKA
jgi:hypothetical protein